jgi:hypothetical protein
VNRVEMESLQLRASAETAHGSVDGSWWEHREGHNVPATRLTMPMPSYWGLRNTLPLENDRMLRPARSYCVELPHPRYQSPRSMMQRWPLTDPNVIDYAPPTSSYRCLRIPERDVTP